MNKKKFSVIALVLLVVMAISALVLAACNPDDTPADTSSDTEATEGLLISAHLQLRLQSHRHFGRFPAFGDELVGRKAVQLLRRA